ncbi:MAG TPA: GAF domain-containing protein, partial [Myxococcaceae bacterium]|nr:GAF domain-containing protein [Myxococcaceae bacterium]
MSPKTAPSVAQLAEQDVSPRQETRSVGLDLLSASREWETTAASVARLAVETFCDWSIIDMLDDAGMQHRVAVDHADPSKADLAMEIRRYPPNPGLTPAASETIRAGRSLLASIVREQEIDSRARDNRQAELARKIGMASYIVSPLVARGRVLGTVSFVRVSRKRPFTQGDVSRAEEMARQAALAIDNARLAAEASKTAERVARLQNVTAALSEAVTPRKVADAVLEQAMASLVAETGAVWLVNAPANRAELLSHRNFDDTSVEEYRVLPLDRHLPMTDAIRTGEAVWLGSRSDYARHYPDNKAVELIPHELATACLPLVVDRRVIGGVALSFPHARFIGPSERAFLLAIARQCAQALERAQLYEKERAARAEAESAHRLLEAVVQAAPIGISLLERDGTVRMWNPAFERITGWPAEEALGRVAPSIPEQCREELLSKFGRVVAGKPVEPYEGPRHRKNGEPYAAAVWMSRLERGEEKPQVLVMMADVTERKRDEDWQRFLAQAGEVLSSSLDYEQTLQAVAKLAVPALATVAMVDGPRINAREPLAVASVEPAQEALVREMRRRYPLREVDPVAVAFRTGTARLYVHPEPDAIRRFAVDEGHARMILDTRMRSSMVVPLIARGQTLGVFSLASAERIYEPRDLAFAEELARRAAIAIDNARLYR